MLGELTEWISSIAAVVTLGTFFWYLVRQFKPNNKDRVDKIRKARTWQEIWQYRENDPSLNEDLRKCTGDPDAQHISIENSARSSMEWWKYYQLAFDLTNPRPLARPPTPRTLKFLGRHLPKELESHREEIEQYFQDGLADPKQKRRKWFSITEHSSLTLFIGKAKLFKFSKTWRRTIR